MDRPLSHARFFVRLSRRWRPHQGSGSPSIPPCMSLLCPPPSSPLTPFLCLLSSPLVHLPRRRRHHPPGLGGGGLRGGLQGGKRDGEPLGLREVVDRLPDEAPHGQGRDVRALPPSLPPSLLYLTLRLTSLAIFFLRAWLPF
jgi:hypothetical protein